jgi:hypothetical protein
MAEGREAISALLCQHGQSFVDFARILAGARSLEQLVRSFEISQADQLFSSVRWIFNR